MALTLAEFIKKYKFKPGMDWLGGSRYQQTVLKNHPEGWLYGIFLEVDGFGNAQSLIKKLIESGRTPGGRTHLLWKDDHKFGNAEFQLIQSRAKKLASLVKQYPQQEWYISGACENLYNKQQALDVAQTVLNIMPNYVTFVHTPDVGGVIIKGDRIISEVHKPNMIKSANAFSSDGINSVDLEFEQIKKSCSHHRYVMFWNSQNNGMEKLPEKPEDREQRKERDGFPTKQEIRSWEYIMMNEKGETKFPENWVYKSHADRHKTPPEPRAGEPVIISPKKFKSIILRTKSGKKIATADYDKPFKGGGFIYRIDGVGFKLAEQAKKIEGTPIVEVVADKKVIGTINPAFRDGKDRPVK